MTSLVVEGIGLWVRDGYGKNYHLKPETVYGRKKKEKEGWLIYLIYEGDFQVHQRESEGERRGREEGG